MATKITYTQQGDYLLPDLKLPEQPKVKIGIWGKQRLRYLKNHRPIIYTNYLTSCTLTAYLADIDKEANEMFDRLMSATDVTTVTIVTNAVICIPLNLPMPCPAVGALIPEQEYVCRLSKSGILTVFFLLR